MFTDFGTNRKPICNFVNSSNLHNISHRFLVIADYCSSLRFRQGCIPLF